MGEKEASRGKFIETLRAAAASVGQAEGGLDGDDPFVLVDEAQEARIAELRRQHQEGSYCPDPADVAARIVDDHLA